MAEYLGMCPSTGFLVPCRRACTARCALLTKATTPPPAVNATGPFHGDPSAGFKPLVELQQIGRILAPGPAPIPYRGVTWDFVDDPKQCSHPGCPYTLPCPRHIQP